jgi:hypothetical protein
MTKKRNKIRNNIFLLLLLFVADIFCFSGQAKADGGSVIALRISPPSYDLKINPGEEKTGKLYIENTSETDIEVQAEFSNFFVDDEGDYIFSGDKEITNENLKPYLMSNWFSLSENNFTLSRGGSKTVEYRVRVPREANLGGHYGAIFFRSVCKTPDDKAVVSSDKSSVCVSGRVGTLFLVQAGGEAARKGILKKIDVPKLSLDEKINFSVEIENAGNTHFRPEGEIVSTNLFGQELSKIEIKDKTILPTMSRTFPGSFHRQDLFGIYKIQCSIKDGDGNEMKFRRYVFMPPWKEISITIFVVGIVIWFSRKFKIKKIKK